MKERRTAHTLGYVGRRPGDLLALVERRDLVVADVRRSPRSRVPAWSKSNLGRLLKDRYVHIGELGNVNYRIGGPIALADPEVGLELIRGLPKQVVVMCACRSPVGCHRTTIAELLRAEGWTIEELDWDDVQPGDGQLALPIPGETPDGGGGGGE